MFKLLFVSTVSGSRFTELIDLHITATLSVRTPFPVSTGPGVHHFTLQLYELDYLNTSDKWNSVVFVLL
jgi:hypothetical protein